MKRKAWETIAAEISAIDVAERTADNCKKKWHDICRNTKKKETNRKKEYRLTGGGEGPPERTAIEDKILDVVGPIAAEGVPGGIDSLETTTSYSKESENEESEEEEDIMLTSPQSSMSSVKNRHETKDDDEDDVIPTSPQSCVSRQSLIAPLKKKQKTSEKQDHMLTSPQSSLSFVKNKKIIEDDNDDYDTPTFPQSSESSQSLIAPLKRKQKNEKRSHKGRDIKPVEEGETSNNDSTRTILEIEKQKLDITKQILDVSRDALDTIANIGERLISGQTEILRVLACGSTHSRAFRNLDSHNPDGNTNPQRNVNHPSRNQSNMSSFQSGGVEYSAFPVSQTLENVNFNLSNPGSSYYNM